MARNFYIVLSNPVAGREEEYNKWYTEKHIMDALEIPGIQAVQRFALADVQRRDPPYQWKYMVIYEVEQEGAAETMRILNERSGTPIMPGSDSFDPKHLALVFSPITPRLESAK